MHKVQRPNLKIKESHRDVVELHVKDARVFGVFCVFDEGPFNSSRMLSISTKSNASPVKIFKNLIPFQALLESCRD